MLVAGSGLIIRLRKDIVGSTPTRPTKEIKELRTCSVIVFFKGSTKGQRSFFAKTSRAIALTHQNCNSR